jgi:hypothetical protein
VTVPLPASATVLEEGCDQRLSARDPELGHRARQEHAHCRGGDPKLVRDQLVGVAETGKANDLALAAGQSIEVWGGGRVLARNHVPPAVLVEFVDQCPTRIDQTTPLGHGFYRRAAEPFEIDTTELVFLNSSGIRALGELVLFARSQNKSLVIIGTSSIPWQRKTFTSLQKIHDQIEIRLRS